MPMGAMPNGAEYSWPKSVVAVERFEMFTSTRGTKPSSSNAARLSRSAALSSTPPETYANTGRGRCRRAACSKSSSERIRSSFATYGFLSIACGELKTGSAEERSTQRTRREKGNASYSWRHDQYREDMQCCFALCVLRSSALTVLSAQRPARECSPGFAVFQQTGGT